MIIPQSIRDKGLVAMRTWQTAFNDEISREGNIHLAAIKASYAVNFQGNGQLDSQSMNLRDSDGQNCAGCLFASGGKCRVSGEVIEKNKISDFFLSKDAVFVLPPAPPSIWAKAKSFLGGQDMTGRGFKVVTYPDGQDLWIAWYSNPYQDREGEHFAEKSLDADLAYMRETGDLPELWFSHIAGTKHGKAHWVGKIGRFAVAIGTFDDTQLARDFKAYYAENPNLKVSHGYLFNPNLRVKGVYYRHHTFEISPLPDGWASNPYTGIYLGDVSMELTQEEVVQLVTALKGHDGLAAKIIQLSQGATAQLDALGVSRKSTAQAEAEAALHSAFATALEPLVTAVKSQNELLTALVNAQVKGQGKGQMDDGEDDGEDDTEAQQEEKGNPPAGLTPDDDPRIQALIQQAQKQMGQPKQPAQASGGQAVFELIQGAMGNSGGGS